jgi:DNA repair exonuclease SbcCD ATPase subunit
MIRLEKISLSHVGPFAEKDLEFSPGLNLVIGPNESGKTTAARAILAAIVGEPNAERLHRRTHAGAFGAAVRLATDDGAWIIDRNFESHDVRVLQVTDGHAVERFRGPLPPRARSAHVQAYRQLVAPLFGLPDLQLLPPLLGGELERVWSDEAAAHLRQLLSGQLLHDHEKVKKALLEKYFAITKVNPIGRNRGKAGRLELVEEQLQECQAAFDRALASADEFAKAEALFTLGEQRQAAIDKEIQAVALSLERLATVRAVREKLAKAEERAQALALDQRQNAALQAKLAEMQTALRALAAVDALTDEQALALRRKRGLLATADEREARWSAAAQEENGRPRAAWRWGAAALLAVAALGAAGLLLLPAWRLVVAIVAGVAGAAGLAWTARGWLLASAVKKARQARLQDLAADRDQALAEAAGLAVGAGLDHLGAAEIEETLQRVEAARGLRQQAERVRAQLEILPPLAELDQAQAQLTQQTAQAQAELARLLAESPELNGEPATLATAFAARRDALAAALSNAQRERDDALSLVGQSRARLDNPAAWREQLADLAAEKDHLLVEGQALWIAVETMDEALTGFMDEDLARLAGGTQALFDQLVAGNRRAVAVAPDLSPKLTAGEAEFDLELLSRATAEQLLLCRRLALLDHLTGDARAPLWLDDAALGYDRARRAHLLDLLREVARRRQVILFTPDEELADLAGEAAHVVRLT